MAADKKTPKIRTVVNLLRTKIISDGAHLYEWNGTYYKKMDEHEWKKRIWSMYSSKYTDWRGNLYHEIHEQLMVETHIPPSSFAIPENMVVFEDAIIDISTGKRIEPSRDIHATFALPYPYIKGEPTLFLQTIEEILPDPVDRDKVLAFFKYCLTSSIKRQVSLICFGDGSNGKTALLELMMSLLGDQAAPASLDRFFKEEDRAKVSLKGKTFVRFPEIGNSFMKRVTMDVIKSLITDSFLSGRGAYEKASSWINTAKLVFDGNKLPQVEDPDDMAFFRRFEIIKFTQKFEGENCDKTRMERIFKSEASQVLSYLASYVPAWNYSVDATATCETWLGIADNVRTFFNEEMTNDDGSHMKSVNYGDVWTWFRIYHTWCKEHHIEKQVTRKTFRAHLERCCPILEEGEYDDEEEEEIEE